MKQNRKKPLYRKVNTKARGVHHDFGGDYKNNRKEKALVSMRNGAQRGLDYTPLFKFLLSKVGENWDNVHSEAVARLDKEEPIYWMVSKNTENQNDFVRLSESSYYSGLFIDEKNILQKVAPDLSEDTLTPFCNCCTHTFNGVPFTKKYIKQE